MALSIDILTPEAKVYNGKADSISIPTPQGELTLLPGHIPVITMLEAGELVLIKDQKKEPLAISKGFAHIAGDHISILVEAAIHIDSIDLDEVVQAQARAQKALADAQSQQDSDPAHIESLESFIRYTLTQFRMKKVKKN